ncbi:amino acid/amide ABC transporter membrane protein 2, HAAT family [Salinihabitans flavidus]|uniref:Amino acid/amide ABC transporter membrane protein 2, HAAT family n=1 Tax=Salinihabitans flavidus TaxID=569882 RepID=A0A1H8RL74_9RHOB|nr:branched-chain amino acid ABC transporter permease [Salinihabitans flavidus]SEO67160.1 amino acid/amide ABC transporter membrane protein 2, HAAT family [Salinihabitans flavidus]
MNRDLAKTMALAGLGGAAFLCVPLVANSGVVFLAGLVAINIVFALSWNLLFAGAGLLSFGHSMFLAAGAYTMAKFSLSAPEVPFLLTLVLAALSGGVLAWVFGFVALRRASGTYFAILTLAFSALVHIVITKTDALGRADGLVGIRRPEIGVGSLRLSLDGDMYYVFIVLSMTLAALALWCFTHSPTGRLLQAIKQDRLRTSFLGANVRRWQLLAFCVSGVFAALAGAVMAPWSQIVSPEIAHWSMSTMPILYALLGGTSRFWGPALGAILFGMLDYGTRNMLGLADMTSGILLLVVVLAVPGGILGLLLRVGRTREEAKG